MKCLNKLVHFISILLLIFFIASDLHAAPGGKISGRVTDRATRQPLPGANVMIKDTRLGAVTDPDGYYFIINVPPGTYRLQASLMGYATVVQEDLDVNLNQTTNADFTLPQQAIEGETVVIKASRPAIQRDISSSQVIVSEEAIQSRPLENLEQILATEAGINLTAGTDGTGLVVRGGGLEETDIVIDGLSTRNERNQQPLTTISLTAIKEIEVLTGGFNAEYGDIRSGMISVITKEGSLDRYSVNADLRVSPPARKHFGASPFSVDGPFWRTYAGKDAFTGVTQKMVDDGQYPFTFVGWNEVARQFAADPDPGNDVTPQEALEIWKWQHRIRKYADKPDYIGDVSISGPIPKTGIAFLASQRYEDLQLIYPFSRNNSIGSTTLLKLTTNLTPKMKLSFNNQYMMIKGVAGSIYEGSTGVITGSREGNQYAQNAFFWRYMWNDASFNPVDIQQYRGGLSLTHVLSPQTYYDARIEYTNYRIVQEPIGLRDTTGVKQIGGKWYDEAPWGYVGSALGSITEKYDILGDFLMSGGGRGQDHSRYWGVRLSADMVSQIDRHNEIKTGIELDYTTFKERREINHGQTTQPYTEAPENWWYYDQSPIKLGAYIQDKLEYMGMIANIGVRMDYMQPGTDPYNLDPQFIFSQLPYNMLAFQENGNSFSNFATGDKSYKLYLSPRLGISHPVTSSSKIFFNYGHFYQPPVTDYLYTVRPRTSGAELPNLGAEWPRTVAYEIGIEKSFAQSLLLRFMGYYKDVTNQLSRQDIVALDEASTVSTWANNSYADIRGLELRLEKRLGQWWHGYVTAEYMVRSTGFTGLRYIYEDRQLAREQRENTNQQRGYPVPSLTADLTFKTPVDLGPLFMGIRPLGNWQLNILQGWSDGGKELLNPDALLSEQRWVESIDWWNTDLLLEKRFDFNRKRVGFFMQVRNLFDYKGFVSPFYWNKYVDSLHLPWEKGDQKGNDKLGEGPSSDKPYIDVGWNDWSHYINPRDIFFGVRIQF
ncbi:MAG TPA: TonB-dependent receptor [bacterium]|nr:TonB-dependent receptor [bacterium]HPG81872.1 TonB-dependent receptor [bacterium]HPM58184.1 TonB-dependent receptor [bacterium]